VYQPGGRELVLQRRAQVVQRQHAVRGAEAGVGGDGQTLAQRPHQQAGELIVAQAEALGLHHLGATLQYEFAPAWLVHGGLRNTLYSSATVTQASAMLEHYFGNFSALAAWRPVQTQGSSTSSTELRGSYYYAERSSVSLSLSAGQEAVQVSDSELQLADVRSTVLGGRHWLMPSWALNYEWSSTRQGEFYTRSGWRIGVQHLF